MKTNSFRFWRTCMHDTGLIFALSQSTTWCIHREWQERKLGKWKPAIHVTSFGQYRFTNGCLCLTSLETNGNFWIFFCAHRIFMSPCSAFVPDFKVAGGAVLALVSMNPLFTIWHYAMNWFLHRESDCIFHFKNETILAELGSVIEVYIYNTARTSIMKTILLFDSTDRFHLHFLRTSPQCLRSSGDLFKTCSSSYIIL